MGRARPVHAADRVQERHPVGRQQRLQLGEKVTVVVDPDMLEHADRDDPVVLAAFLAVVAQVKMDAVGEPGRGGPARRRLVLFDRKGEPGHLGAALAGEVERQPAPARADVEHPLPGSDHQLGRDVALLVELRLIEVVELIVKVGAGILAVLVEKQLIELVRQIIVVRHVLPGAGHRVILVQLGASG